MELVSMRRMIFAVMALVVVVTAFAVPPGAADHVADHPPAFLLNTGEIVDAETGESLSPPLGVDDVLGYKDAPGGGGYFVTSVGQVIAVSPAQPVTGVDHIRLDAPVVDFDVAPDGGLALFASDGGVFAVGGFVFRGSVADLNLDQDIVAGSITPSGNGYVLLGGDAGTFNMGDSRFAGSRAGQLEALAGADGAVPKPISIRFPESPRDAGVAATSQIISYDNGTEEVLGGPAGGVALQGAVDVFELPAGMRARAITDGFLLTDNNDVYAARLGQIDVVTPDSGTIVGLAERSGSEQALGRFFTTCTIGATETACDGDHELAVGQQLRVRVDESGGAGGFPGATSTSAAVESFAQLAGAEDDATDNHVEAVFTCVARGASDVTVTPDGQDSPVYAASVRCVALVELEVTCTAGGPSSSECPDVTLGLGQTLSVTARGVPGPATMSTTLSLNGVDPVLVQLAPQPAPANDTVPGSELTAIVRCASQDGSSTLLGAKATVVGERNEVSRTTPIQVTCAFEEDDEPIIEPHSVQVVSGTCMGVKHHVGSSEVSLKLNVVGVPVTVTKLTGTLGGPKVLQATVTAVVGLDGSAVVVWPIGLFGNYTVTSLRGTLPDGSTVDLLPQVTPKSVQVTDKDKSCP